MIDKITQNFYMLENECLERFSPQNIVFQYLERYFHDFNMSNDKHKTELTTLVNELMTDNDSKSMLLLFVTCAPFRNLRCSFL